MKIHWNFNFYSGIIHSLVSFFANNVMMNCRDEEGDETASQAVQHGDGPVLSGTGNPFLDVPNVTGATEFKKGYVMRKSCYEANGKKSNYVLFSKLLLVNRVIAPFVATLLIVAIFAIMSIESLFFRIFVLILG